MNVGLSEYVFIFLPHSTQTGYIHIFCESCFMSRLRTRTINNEAGVPRHQPDLSPLRRSIYIYFARPLGEICGDRLRQ